jgi:hypothetical protein
MVKKVLLIVFGAIGTLMGIAMVVIGAALLAFTGSDGWISSPTRSISTNTYAFVFETGRISSGSDTSRNRTDVSVRVRAQAGAGKDVFIGVGPAGDVEQYLSGVPQAEVVDIDLSPFRLSTVRVGGTGTPEPPTDQTFWTAKAFGAGEQTLEWDLQGSSHGYRFVLMNADGSQNVTAQTSMGVRVPFLRSVGTGLLVAGIIVGAVGLGLLIWGLMTKVPPKAPPGMYPPPAGWPPPPGYGPYPPPGYGAGPPGTPPPPGWPPPPGPPGQAGQAGQPGYAGQPGQAGQPGYTGQPGYLPPAGYGQPVQPGQATPPGPAGYPAWATPPAGPAESASPGEAGRETGHETGRETGPTPATGPAAATEATAPTSPGSGRPPEPPERSTESDSFGDPTRPPDTDPRRDG